MNQNRIKFNCDNFFHMMYSQPSHCYNCTARNGYPQNLGGDKNCQNFKPRKNAMKPSASDPEERKLVS